MKNYVAIDGIKKILTETNEQQGWDIPLYVINYEAEILAEKIDHNPWDPQPSYAEQFMKVRTAREALELGNTCWFTRAVFPEYKSRRGIPASYYVDMGKSCYARVLDQSDLPAVRVLCDHFEFLAETVYTAVRHYGQFREMWD
jgi:hypothetical protein